MGSAGPHEHSAAYGQRFRQGRRGAPRRSRSFADPKMSVAGWRGLRDAACARRDVRPHTPPRNPNDHDDDEGVCALPVNGFRGLMPVLGLGLQDGSVVGVADIYPIIAIPNDAGVRVVRLVVGVAPRAKAEA
jgi:hypothetical protein